MKKTSDQLKKEIETIAGVKEGERSKSFFICFDNKDKIKATVAIKNGADIRSVMTQISRDGVNNYRINDFIIEGQYLIIL